MHHINLAGKTAEEEGFFSSGIAATYNGYRHLTEESAVASGTVRDATSGECNLTRNVQLARLGSGSNDHSAGTELLSINGNDFFVTLIDQTGDFTSHRFQAELLAVFLEAHHQVGTVNTAGKTGVILHLGRGHHLATKDHPLY